MGLPSRRSDLERHQNCRTGGWRFKHKLVGSEVSVRLTGTDTNCPGIKSSGSVTRLVLSRWYLQPQNEWVVQRVKTQKDTKIWR